MKARAYGRRIGWVALALLGAGSFLLQPQPGAWGQADNRTPAIRELRVANSSAKSITLTWKVTQGVAITGVSIMRELLGAGRVLATQTWDYKESRFPFNDARQMNWRDPGCSPGTTYRYTV